MRTPNHGEFRHVLNLVNRFIGPGLDNESIAQELLLRSLDDTGPPTYLTIKHYCYDQLRKLQTEQKGNTEYKTILRQQRTATSHSAADLAARLIETAGLTTDEKLVLFHSFYLNQSFSRIAAELAKPITIVADLQWRALEKLKTQARRQQQP